VERSSPGRLSALVAMVPRGSRVAEIGADGAALSRALLRRGTATHCIASDVAAGALAGARRLSGPELAGGRLELRLGSGLSVLTAEDAVDVAVIAGLGGRAIVRLLDTAHRRRRLPPRLVLQPQTEAARVRRWLRQRGLAIVDETLARERGRDYVVLAAEALERTEELWSGPLDLEDLLEAGPRLVASGDPAVRRHWENERDRLERVLARPCRGPSADRAARRLALARRVLACLAPSRNAGDGPAGANWYTPGMRPGSAAVSLGRPAPGSVEEGLGG